MTYQMDHMPRMLRIGLTGPTGAGKGTAAAAFSRFGVPSIDTDKVYHDLLIPPSACLDELVRRFGEGILQPDGTLNRRALAVRVFDEGDERDHDDLNKITHKYVLDMVRACCAGLEKAGVRAVLVDAPLLYESGFDKECGRVLAVLADADVRRARIMARDGISEAQAQSRMDAQQPDGYYIAGADEVIYNDGDPSLLAEAAATVLKKWGVIA